MRLSRGDFDRGARLEGTHFVGSLQQVIDKLLSQREIFGHQRVLAQIDLGGIPFRMVARTIELLATEVAPVVRRETANNPNPPDRQGYEEGLASFRALRNSSRLKRAPKTGEPGARRHPAESGPASRLPGTGLPIRLFIPRGLYIPTDC